MLFNIWKTWWLSAQILSLGCWAWDGNRVAVRLTVRALWVANTLFIRLSVSLFIWLSNYPSQQTAHRRLNVNSTVDGGHVWQLLHLHAGRLILKTRQIQRIQMFLTRNGCDVAAKIRMCVRGSWAGRELSLSGQPVEFRKKARASGSDNKPFRFKSSTHTANNYIGLYWVTVRKWCCQNTNRWIPKEKALII